MDNKKTIFLTGGTGLLGSYLLKLLLEDGCKAYVLARSKKEKNTSARVYDALKFWDSSLMQLKHNLIVLDGDITRNNLGLDKSFFNAITKEVQEIYHCAAVTEFNWPLDKIRNVNVNGTRNVLDLALNCKSLKKVNYISTIFVCGNYAGIFNEGCLDEGQGFGTTYQQTKFEAEKIVNDYRLKDLWIDIFRPPFIVGESVTGKTPFLNMAFYQVLNLWSSGIFDSFPGKGLSVAAIPVDFLTKTIMLINDNFHLRNKTYHPFSEKALSLELILNIASDVLRFKKPKLVPGGGFNLNTLTPTQRLLLHYNVALLNPEIIFSSKDTNELLKKIKREIPNFSKEILKKIVMYQKNNKQ